MSLEFTIPHQGSDIVAAATLVLPNSARRFDVTGTTTITSINTADRQIGQPIRLRFTGAATITHNATNLIVASGANVITTAGQVYDFEVIGVNQVRQIVPVITIPAPSFVGMIDTVNFIIDGGGAAIATGIKGDMVFDYACVIQSVTLLADASGSIVVDLWKDSYANFPPVIGDVITASAKPTLSSASKSQDATLTGWTKTVAAGDIIRVNVNSAATVQRVTLSLKVTRT